MDRKKIVVAIVIAIFLIPGIAGYLGKDDIIYLKTDPKPLSNAFVGTYICDNDSHCSITVIADDNTFYISKDKNDLGETVTKGTFEKVPEQKDTYLLSPEGMEKQRIQTKDLKFDFTMDQTELAFTKSSEIPIMTEDMEK